MRILGVIPARGGSTRIPRKNLQSVGGMTLVERAKKQAEGTVLLDALVISTDDDEIARLFGGNVLRRTCGPDGPMVDVLRDALEQVGGEWDAVVTIQPTSPLRTSEDIDECIRLWSRNPKRTTVSVDAQTRMRNGAVYVTPVERVRNGLVYVDSDYDDEYAMPASRSLDINEWADLEEARRVLGP